LEEIMRVLKSVTAGSLESSDVLVTIMPLSEDRIEYDIESIVIKQYGRRIRKVTEDMVEIAKITGARIHVQDRGALECTLRARLETAIERSIAC
jgi:citrate lyase subunit gamma (acyl carrier protein)